MRLTIGTLVTSCLCVVAASAQTQPPPLSRQQRDLLQSLVAAVDRAAAPSQPDHAWLTHVLRASDGSHYVAFSVTPPAAALSDKPVIVYVRLATAPPPGAIATTERSAVREWLLGSRIDPRLLPQRRAVAIGDMPPMGAGSIGARGASSVGSADLQAMDLERQRAREKRNDDERRRRATLEGSGSTDSDQLPFEDFEINGKAVVSDKAWAIQRALTAGPGSYDLFVAWTDATQPATGATVHVARRSLQLGPAPAAEFALSTVIVADAIGVRQTPYNSLEQRAHPYSIGVTEITPARDSVFTPMERLAVAFQIINAMPSASGKPDVRVNLRIVRATGVREGAIASLSPLTYNASSLPADFDVRLGHPLIAALAVPLTTIARGDYRLAITVEDRISSTVVAGGVGFTVVGTPETLLSEAPALGRRFHPDSVVSGSILDEVLSGLAPPMASSELTRLLQSARVGRLADLLVADAVSPSEQGVRMALTGLALLSLGNPSAMSEFERAQAAQAPLGPVRFLLAATRAMQGRDGEAIAAWEEARKAGFPAASVDRLVAEAYLRQKDFRRAADAIGAHPLADPADIRTFAATRIGTRRESDAVTALDALLARDADDLEARWLLVHALYSAHVNGARDQRPRLLTEAQRYIDAKGDHAALASEWLAQVK